MAKKAEKSDAPPAAALRVPKHGHGALRVGNPGNIGKKRDAFRAALATMVSDKETLKHVRAVLSMPDHPFFPKLLEWAAEQGFGKVAQPQEITGDVTLTVSYQHE